MRRSDDLDRPGLEAILERYKRDDGADLAHRGIDYREFLKFIGNQLCPQAYLEIGTHQGDSLEQFDCASVCIDPDFMVSRNVIGRKPNAFFFQMTSDDFFEAYDPRDFVGEIDVGFLDGLHHFEALLRDFINFERHSHSRSIALLHDCLPLNVRMAGRDHAHGPDTEPEFMRPFWTGDVWRVLPILRAARPDLTLVAVDCPPTGLILCFGLDNRSTSLLYDYRNLVAGYAARPLGELGLQNLWNLVPILSSRKIVAEPRLFRELLKFRN